MPIPFILAGVATGITALGTTVFAVGANAIKNEAQNELIELNNKIKREIDFIEARYTDVVNDYNGKIRSLIVIKERAYNGTLEEFKNIYENISNIDIEEVDFNSNSLEVKNDVNIYFANNSLKYEYKHNTDELILGTILSTTLGPIFIVNSFFKYKKIQEGIEEAEATLKAVETKVKAIDVKIQKIKYDVRQIELVTKLLKSTNIRFRMALNKFAKNVGEYGYNYNAYPIEVKKQFKMTRDYAIVTSLIIKSSGIKEDGTLDNQINEAVEYANKVLKALGNY